MYLTSIDIADFYYDIKVHLDNIYDVYYAIDYTSDPNNFDNNNSLNDDFIPDMKRQYEEDFIVYRQRTLPKYHVRMENLLIAAGNTSVGLAKAQKLFDTTVEYYITYIKRCNHCKTHISEKDPEKSMDLALSHVITILDSFLNHFYKELSLYTKVKLAYTDDVLSIISNVLDVKEGLDNKSQNELIYTFKEAMSEQSNLSKLTKLIEHFKLRTDEDFLSACTKQKALYTALVPYLKLKYKATGKFRKLLINEFSLKKVCSDRALRNEYIESDDWEEKFKDYMKLG